MAFVSSPPPEGGGSVHPALSDAELVAILVDEGFDGEAWRAAEAVLAAVAVPVLHDLLLGGTIARKSFALDRPIAPTAEEMDALRRHDDDRADIVHAAVVDGLRLFRRLTLAGRGWREDGGASLLTYVLNGCVRALANPYRTWRVRQNRVRALESWTGIGDTNESASPDPDPLVQLVTEEEWQILIASMPPQLARAVEVWRLTGESWTLIAARLGISGRSLEGLLRRWRRSRRSNEEYVT